MISIVISEKGGVERRENYDQSEITVGRVKGNDVLLPKGNVSKRHARLIVRDGRYIVTDLKSTNGTYVNHRRITHATLVREGDRIYIGDFVLRIETPDSDLAEATGTHSSTHSSNLEEELRASRTSNHVTAAPPIPDREDIVSHFPIEHDPDESIAASGLPAPPPIPTGLRDARRAPTPMRSHAPTPARLYRRPSGELVASYGIEPSSAATTTGSGTGFPNSGDDRRQQQNELLGQLLQSVEDRIGLDRLAAISVDTDLAKEVDEALDAAADEVRESSAKPQALVIDELKQAARRELLELGPLTRALDDPSLSQIKIWHRQVAISRQGNSNSTDALDFGTDGGVRRVLERLCSGSDVDLSSDASHMESVDVRGFRFTLLRPPFTSGGQLVSLIRKHKSTTSLDALVRQGTLSRGMAKLLDRCVRGGGSILVFGASQSGTADLIGALAQSHSSRVGALWLCNDACDFVPADAARVLLGDNGDPDRREAALHAALQLGSEQLVIPPTASDVLPGVLDWTTREAAGVLCAMHANSLNRGIEGLIGQLAKARPELNPATARQWLLSGFDLAVEVARLRDGRSRITRLSELRPDRTPALRDIFNFSYERTVSGGSIEGSFTSSGVVPRIVHDLTARGYPIDQGLFRRQGV